MWALVRLSANDQPNSSHSAHAVWHVSPRGASLHPSLIPPFLPAFLPSFLPSSLPSKAVCIHMYTCVYIYICVYNDRPLRGAAQPHGEEERRGGPLRFSVLIRAMQPRSSPALCTTSDCAGASAVALLLIPRSCPLVLFRISARAAPPLLQVRIAAAKGRGF